MSEAPQSTEISNGPTGGDSNGREEQSGEFDISDILKEGVSLSETDSPVLGHSAAGSNSTSRSQPSHIAADSRAQQSYSPSEMSDVSLTGAPPGYKMAAGHTTLSVANVGKSKNAADLSDKLDTLKKWSVSTFKCTRQLMSEKLGKGTRTVDPELEAQIEVLRDTQRRYANILRLGKAFNNHFFYVVQTQRQFGELFGDLAQKNPELHEEFTHNAESQRSLVRNGETLCGALTFFISSMDTLINKTIEDTLQTVKHYENARLEYDAYRQDWEALQGAASSPGMKDGATQSNIHATQQQVSRQQRRYEQLRKDVTIKLKFLDENRVKVMRKQLVLFSNCITAYFTGNEAALETTLKQFSIKLKMPNADSPSWLEANSPPGHQQ